MAAQKDSDHYSNDEAKKRMDAAVRRALNTPPKPQKEMTKKPTAMAKKRTTRQTEKS